MVEEEINLAIEAQYYLSVIWLLMSGHSCFHISLVARCEAAEQVPLEPLSSSSDPAS